MRQWREHPIAESVSIHRIGRQPSQGCITRLRSGSKSTRKHLSVPILTPFGYIKRSAVAVTHTEDRAHLLLGAGPQIRSFPLHVFRL